MSNVKKYCEISETDDGLYSVSRIAQSVMNDADDVNNGDAYAYFSTEKSVDLLTRKCRSMVDKAKSEVMAQAQAAYQKGYREGYDQSYNEAYTTEASKYKSDGNSAAALLNEFDKKLNELAAENSKKNDHLEDALVLAKEIIKNELGVNEDAIFGLYKKAASHISNVETATLKVSTHNAEIVKKNLVKFEDQIDGLTELNVVESGDDDGKCILETSLGNIDASADKQFERAKKIMMSEI